MLNILIPIDGSKSAMQAVDYAIQYRRSHNEPISVNLINVQPRLSRYLTRFVASRNVQLLQKERANTALKDATELLREAGMEYSVHLEKGKTAETIVACARETGAHKIVVGTTRKNALTRFFQGSVVNKVMGLTDLPVEVIAKENATKLERFGIPVGLGLTFLWLAVE